MHGDTENCEKIPGPSRAVEADSNITVVQPKLESNPTLAVKPHVNSRPWLPNSFILPLEIFQIVLRSKVKDGLYYRDASATFLETWSGDSKAVWPC